MMQNTKPTIIRHMFLLIFIFLSCSHHKPHITAFYRDKSFVNAQLVESALGIGGIISIDHQFDNGEFDNFARLLHEVLREKRGDLVLASVQQVIETIENTTYDKIMSEYQEYPTSVLKSLLEIAFVENDIRYLLLSSIDLNEISEDQYKEVKPKEISTTSLVDTDLNVDEEETLEEEVLAVFKTTRKIRISFHIYDLKNASLVWRGTFEDSGSNSRSIVLDDEGGVVQEFAQPLSLGVIQGLYGSALQPRAPKFEILLKRVFISFAEQLP